MVEAFSPSDVKVDSHSFFEWKEKVAERIIQRVRENLSAFTMRGVYQASIYKEGLLPKEHQAAGVGTRIKIDAGIKKVVKYSLREAGWEKVEIEEGEEGLKVTLTTPNV